jgi:hypothetical protein
MAANFEDLRARIAVRRADVDTEELDLAGRKRMSNEALVVAPDLK